MLFSPKKSIVAVLKHFLQKRNRVIVPAMVQIGRPRRIDVFRNTGFNDYIRLSTLELCAEEIISANAPGALAEVGVYRGDFAMMMNALLPDRTLYLFDTFSSFDPGQHAEEERLRGLRHVHHFHDTSEHLVLSRMIAPHVCVVKKGLFPATTEGITDLFALVSLDADLYQPIYDGLNYFWPRLNPGGCILVHDYNNAKYPGVRLAVRQFSREQQVRFTPVSDTYGTAIFLK